VIGPAKLLVPLFWIAPTMNPPVPLISSGSAVV
jgi:hypothetical protein